MNNDNEIIKEFELEFEKVERARDLLNRQKAEIERLKEENEFHFRLERLLAEQRDKRDGLIEQIDAQNDELRIRLITAKFEAIKEFWNRLSENADTTQVDAFHSAYLIKDEDAENLIKEMTEQRGDSK